MQKHRKIFGVLGNTHAAVTIFTVIIFIDQVTKLLADKSGNARINTGISFGIGEFTQSFVTTIVVSAVLVLVLYIGRNIWQRQPIVAGLFFGGALSNIIDRIVFSGVRDWLLVPGFSVTNNLADCAIVLGAVIFIATILLTDTEELHGN